MGELKALVATLKGRDLPEPPKSPSSKQLALEETRGVLTSFIKDAAVGLISAAASSFPFGSVAVALVGEVASRVQTLKENEEAAMKLGKLATRICKRGERYLVHLDAAGDGEGVEVAQQMLQLTFLAMRLVCELQERKGVLKKILVFVGSPRAKEALEQLTADLKDAQLDVVYVAGDVALGRVMAAHPQWQSAGAAAAAVQ
jgi:hypothetical protein